jgi:nicotinamidase-related amidase
MRTIFGKQVCETLEEVLNPDWCAILPIDLQNDFMDPEGSVAKVGGNVGPMQALLPRVVSFMDRARELGVPIIHVRIVDLPDGASDSPSWLRAKGLISGVSSFAVEGTWGAEFCKGCAPRPGELVVTKHRSSAFVGTNLDALLRANDIKTVVVIGEQTPGCVEATYRDAAYYDYYNVLIEDLVAAREDDLHEASIRIQKARHDVCTAAEALGIWETARAAVRKIPGAAAVGASA